MFFFFVLSILCFILSLLSFHIDDILRLVHSIQSVQVIFNRSQKGSFFVSSVGSLRLLFVVTRDVITDDYICYTLGRALLFRYIIMHLVGKCCWYLIINWSTGDYFRSEGCFLVATDLLKGCYFFILWTENDCQDGHENDITKPSICEFYVYELSQLIGYVCFIWFLWRKFT